MQLNYYDPPAQTCLLTLCSDVLQSRRMRVLMRGPEERTGGAPVRRSRRLSAPLKAPNRTPATLRSPQRRPPNRRRAAAASLKPAALGRKWRPRILTSFRSAPESRVCSLKASRAPSTCPSACGPTGRRWTSSRRSSPLTSLLSWSSSSEAAGGIWWGPSRCCCPAGVLTGARTRRTTRTLKPCCCLQTDTCSSTWAHTTRCPPAPSGRWALLSGSPSRSGSQRTRHRAWCPRDRWVSPCNTRPFRSPRATRSCCATLWHAARAAPSYTMTWLCGIPWPSSSSTSSARRPSTCPRSPPQPPWGPGDQCSAAPPSCPPDPPRSSASASRRRAARWGPNPASTPRRRSTRSAPTPQTRASSTPPPEEAADGLTQQMGGGHTCIILKGLPVCYRVFFCLVLNWTVWSNHPLMRWC